MQTSKYVLVTPVRDEVSTIGLTIECVTKQTVLPLEWVIVSDGSTDGTDEVILNAAKSHPWIRLVALPPRLTRSFAAVVHNTETGIRAVRNREYGFIGLLDADVTFQNDYFEQLLQRFEVNPKLGLAGGVVIDVGLSKERLPKNRFDVPGAVQFFRRECFDSLGSLLPIPEGGWDAMTCAMARMNGYQTALCTDLVVDHLKPRNISQGGVFRRKWQLGLRDYALGYHPIFELIKCIGRVPDSPFLVGAIAWWLGYCTASLRKYPRIVPSNVIEHVKSEQRRRMLSLLRVPYRGKQNRSPSTAADAAS